MNLFSKIKKVHKNNFSRKFESGEHVERDWGVMLIGFTVLVLLIVILEGYLFMRINRGDFFSNQSTSGVRTETLNRKTLLDVAGYFEAREKEYADFRATSTPQIDPSI